MPLVAHFGRFDRLTAASSVQAMEGHLLVEHYLDHAVLIIYNKEIKVHKKSFYEKLKLINYPGLTPRV